MENTFATPALLLTYLMAGKVLFTVTNTATGKHFTFKIWKAKASVKFPGTTYFVSVMTGPDNEASYSSLGMIKSGKFFSYGKAVIRPTALSFTAFAWLWERVSAEKALPATVVVQHSGCCGRCSRTLTTMLSVNRGIGPECWEKMGFTPEPEAEPVTPLAKTIAAHEAAKPAMMEEIFRAAELANRKPSAATKIVLPVETEEIGERMVNLATPEELAASLALSRRENLSLPYAYEKLFPAYPCGA